MGQHSIDLQPAVEGFENNTYPVLFVVLFAFVQSSQLVETSGKCTVELSIKGMKMGLEFYAWVCKNCLVSKSLQNVLFNA